MRKTTEIYDDFSLSVLDETKWAIAGFPLETGEMWYYSEPDAQTKIHDGKLWLMVNPFTKFHDSVQILDNPKHVYASTKSFEIPDNGEILFEMEMGAENFNANSKDIRDGFASFNLMDFKTGMILDFVASGDTIAAVYEILLIPGLTDKNTAFTIIDELDISTKPGQMHHYKISYNKSENRAVWYADDVEVKSVNNIPVKIESIVLGIGLITLKLISENGSTSLHGQGARGSWGNVKISK